MNPLSGAHQLSRVKINGFKSIKKCDLELGVVNVLIGSNGAGKSNFIAFFQMVRQLLEKNLQRYVGGQGGPDAVLHFGRKTTPRLEAELYFKDKGYQFALEATQGNRLMFYDEALWSRESGRQPVGSGHFETEVHCLKASDPVYPAIIPFMKTWRCYHFHDTSETAFVKQPHGINDNAYLRPDASNLAAFLYLLQSRHELSYRAIINAIRLTAPFFGDFHLRPSPHNKEVIELEWTERGRDIPFKAHHLSDGTLRFISLTTLFLQPDDFKPEIIFVDEPELGLHPVAITLLASMIRSEAVKRQLIVSTQSVEFVNAFDAAELVVADRVDGKTTLQRLDPDALNEWLQEYSLGELWKKNIIGGRPAR